MGGIFNINGGELVVILLVAALVVGPDRLPQYTEQLTRLVRQVKAFASKAKERVDEEVSQEIGDVDWAALDPRRYDPRTIVREALLDDGPGVSPAARRGAPARATAGGAPRPAGPGLHAPAPGTPAPYDDEAT